MCHTQCVGLVVRLHQAAYFLLYHSDNNTLYSVCAEYVSFGVVLDHLQELSTAQPATPANTLVNSAVTKRGDPV